MEILIILSFIALGISSFLVNIKKNERLYGIFNYLFFVAVCLFSIQGFKNQEDGISLISFSVIFVSIHIMINQLFKQKWIGILSILSVAFFIVFRDTKYEFQNYPLLFDFNNLFILPIIGVVFPFVVHYKSKFLELIFKQHHLSGSLYFMSLGFIVFVGLLLGSTFGVFLSAISYYIAEMHFNKLKESKQYHSFYLFVITLLLMFIHQSELELASFLHGSILLGLFVGVGIALWINQFQNFKELSIFKRIVSFLIPIILISSLIFIELIKEHLGGLSAFTGIIVGIILRDKQVHKTLTLSTISIGFGILFIAIPFLQTEKREQKENEKIQILKVEKNQELSKNSLDLAGKNLSEIVGFWKISSKNSKIDFELGPKDTRTKGMFKIVEGDIEIRKEIQNSKINVIIPISGFSTFNSFRDQELRESDYFDSKKFPELSFENNSEDLKLKKLDDFYVVEGILEMKGIKQKLEIELKLIDFGKDKKGEFAILVGKSSLDRSKHNMKSDPKVGDIVDFTFELELRK